MNRSFRKIILEPKNYFSELFSYISWQKVLVFILIIVFFANIGVFIYMKNKEYKVQELDLSSYNVTNPFNAENSLDYNLPFGSGMANSTADLMASDPDVEGVFNQKQAKTDSVAPVAKIKLVTSSLTEGFFEGDTIFLSAIDSHDPDGKIKEYRWDFDQSNGLNIDATGVTTTAKYNTSGVYTITLMVIDDMGVENSTSLTLTIQKKPEEKPNLLGITTSLIDFDNLDYTSRAEVKNASEKSYAMFYAQATSNMAQAIYNNQNKALPSLPALSEIELSVNKDYSNSPIVVDSVLPKDGGKTYTTKPIITATFVGKNDTDVESIELLVDGQSVTQYTTRSKYGVNYTPAEDLSYGTHNVSLMVSDVAEQRTIKSWSFTVVNKEDELAGIVEEYVDEEGPQLTLKIPDTNAKNVKPNSDIKLSFNEPVDITTFQLAVVDKTTNVSKLFTGSEVEWNASNTSLVINVDTPIFDYDHSYQLISKQKDKLGNESIHEWLATCEEYSAPEITITYPKNKAVFSQPKVEVTGYADPTYLVFIGEETATVNSKGAFTAEISLDMGENNIEVVVKDLKGKKSTSYLTLTYDPYANEGNPVIAPQDSPVIMDASIRDGETIDMVRPQISFVYADSDDIDTNSIKIKLDGKDVTNFAFITRDSLTYKPLEELTEGEHEIYFVVADTLGNTTRYEMTFNVSAYPDQPQSLTARLTGNNKKVLLMWDTITNIQAPEYRIYRAIDANVTTTAVYEVGRTDGTSFEDDTVVDGVTYYYIVAAVSDDEIIGQESNKISIRVDWTAPNFQIFNPNKDEVTSLQTYTLKGIVNDDDVKQIVITLNNKQFDTPEILDDKTFSSDLLLSPGENIIQTLVVDNDGNESIDIRILTYNPPDVERPYAEWISPKGTDVAIDSNIVIKYNEAIDKNSVKIYIKDKENPNNVNPITINNIELQLSDDLKTVTYNPKEDLEYYIEYEVIVEATDLEGNKSLDDDWNFRTAKKEAPYLEVTTPVEGAVFDSPEIFVSGKTEKDITISVFINGNQVLPDTVSIANGLFSTHITLDDFENVLTIVATDKFNNATTIVRNVYYNAPDTIPPEVVISSPTTGVTVGTSKTNIQGRTDPDSKVTITVNGADQGLVDVNSSGFFNHEITLQPGINLINIASTDSSGNVTNKTITMTLDTTGPLIAIANPPDGFTTNVSRVEIRGNVEKRDYQAYTTMYCTVNNGEKIDILVTEDGRFNQFVNLATGVNHIVVVATDSYGNMTTRELNVYLDVAGTTGSLINNNTGTANSLVASTTNNGQNMNSIATLELGETQQSNSTSAVLNSFSTNNVLTTNSFSTTDTGTGSISINNSYANGNSGSSTGVIDPSTGEKKYWGGDNQAPSLNVNSLNGTTTSNSNNTIYGSTEPEANVTILQNGKTTFTGNASSTDGSFVANVTLNEGHNIFTTATSDSSGNINFSNTVVELDTNGPATNILAPTYDAHIKDAKYLVKISTEPNTKVEIAIGQDGVYSIKTDSEFKSDETGLARYNINIKEEDEGEKNLRVITTDKLGNKTTKYVPVIIDISAPEIIDIYLEEAFSSDKHVVMENKILSSNATNSGIIIGANSTFISGKTEPDCTVQLIMSGTNVLGSGKSDNNGNFKIKIGSVSGNNMTDIQLKVIDNFENDSTVNFKIMADAVSPTVTVISPSGVETAIIDADIQHSLESYTEIDEYAVDTEGNQYATHESEVYRNKAVQEIVYYNLIKDVDITAHPVELENGKLKIKFTTIDYSPKISYSIYVNNEKVKQRNNVSYTSIETNQGYKTEIEETIVPPTGVFDLKIVVTDSALNTTTKNIALLNHAETIDETVSTGPIDRTINIVFDTSNIVEDNKDNYIAQEYSCWEEQDPNYPDDPTKKITVCGTKYKWQLRDYANPTMDSLSDTYKSVYNSLSNFNQSSETDEHGNPKPKIGAVTDNTGKSNPYKLDDNKLTDGLAIPQGMSPHKDVADIYDNLNPSGSLFESVWDLMAQAGSNILDKIKGLIGA